MVKADLPSHLGGGLAQKLGMIPSPVRVQMEYGAEAPRLPWRLSRVAGSEWAAAPRPLASENPKCPLEVLKVSFDQIGASGACALAGSLAEPTCRLLGLRTDALRQLVPATHHGECNRVRGVVVTSVQSIANMQLWKQYSFKRQQNAQAIRAHQACP